MGSDRVRTVDPQGAAAGLEPGSAPLSRFPGGHLHGRPLDRFGPRHLRPFRSGRAFRTARGVVETRPGRLGHRFSVRLARHLRHVPLDASLAPAPLARRAYDQLCPLRDHHGSRSVCRYRRRQLGGPVDGDRLGCARRADRFAAPGCAPVEKGSPGRPGPSAGAPPDNGGIGPKGQYGGTHACGPPLARVR
jgi:hypothetical protein